jgi:hypothetical protein
MKPVINLQTDETFTIFQPKSKVPTFLIRMSGFRGIAENIKYILTEISDRKSKLHIINEIEL